MSTWMYGERVVQQEVEDGRGDGGITEAWSSLSSVRCGRQRVVCTEDEHGPDSMSRRGLNPLACARHGSRPRGRPMATSRFGIPGSDALDGAGQARTPPRRRGAPRPFSPRRRGLGRSPSLSRSSSRPTAVPMRRPIRDVGRGSCRSGGHERRAHRSLENREPVSTASTGITPGQCDGLKNGDSSMKELDRPDRQATKRHNRVKGLMMRTTRGCRDVVHSESSSIV